ncbi:TauD/TfdA family dioxygenase [Actinacidiphila yeochonensis]|uniref:TauD/TfdA family dioxygenase n=1 Tax=Actinacidiphila yeochonensis TaxID=89050 RepID=UPI00068D3A56|nr:TauD/TfdA family dioxygenase [Actinacidiphila yeochonensis]
MRGTFRERSDHPHVALRGERLDSGARYPAPLRPLPAAAAAPADAAAAVLGQQLPEHGVGHLELDRVMSNEEFRVFGEALGTPQPETSPDVRAMVEDQVILNLRTDGPATSDPARQPFAANSLTLHSESSGAPAPAQPRYIVLMCVSPGDDDGAAQTVVVPMAGVHAALPHTAREVLHRTRYDRDGEAPPVLREAGGRPVFSFRDFGATPLAWAADGVDGGPAAVDRALVELHTAMYGHRAFGFHWRPGRLVVIDNTRHFHGRTRGRAPVAGQARHLKRLRIRAAEGAR